MKRKDQHKPEKNQVRNYPHINHHFIANTLNAIENLIQTDQKEAVLKYFSHFSHFSRIMLNTNYGALTLLSNDLKTLTHFLALVHLRFHNIQCTIEIASGTSTKTLYIPALLLQSYIEDAIWRRLKPKNEAGFLNIIIRQENDHLFFILEDNGIGQKKAQQMQEKRTPIPQERLQLIQEFEHIKVESKDLYDEEGLACGTRVQIQIPAMEVKPFRF